ncbi:MAG: ABC transporter ATP-binding protein [Lachnospiraceae bacterium]|nr:ABC transporter ATP-binding protein [Lachnospiraceae bacterium]
MKKIIKVACVPLIVRIIFHILYSVTIASLPFIIKYMIDDVGKTRTLSASWNYITLFVLMIAVAMVAQYISQKASWKAEYKIFLELRGRYFATIMSYPKSRFGTNSIGNYTSKIENDVVTTTEMIEYGLEIIENVISLVVYAVFLFLLNVKLAIVIYLVTVMTMFLPKITAHRFAERKNKLLLATGDYLEKLSDLMQGFYSTTNTTRDGVVRRHGDELEKLERSRYQFGTYKTFVNVFNGSVMYLIDIVAFAVIAIFLSKKMITVGVAAATLTYIREFALPLRGVVDGISAFKSVRPAAEQVICEAYEKIAKKKAIKNFSNIVVDNVEKHYKGIRGKKYTCTITAGKKYLVQGENGSGKSTLLKMLAQVTLPDEGMLKVDNMDLSEVDISNILLYIPQENHIFKENFANNITWFGSVGKEKWHEIEKYFGAAMSENLPTHSNCSKLSGGEKQQIGILRALMEDKPIIVLDEPFAAMSSERELVFTQLLLEMKNKTIIMVSHNKSKEYADLFDEVILMEDMRMCS